MSDTKLALLAIAIDSTALMCTLSQKQGSLLMGMTTTWKPRGLMDQFLYI